MAESVPASSAQLDVVACIFLNLFEDLIDAIIYFVVICLIIKGNLSLNRNFMRAILRWLERNQVEPRGTQEETRGTSIFTRRNWMTNL